MIKDNTLSPDIVVNNIPAVFLQAAVKAVDLLRFKMDIADDSEIGIMYSSFSEIVKRIEIKENEHNNRTR